jgi:hypothetical protein
MGAQQAGGVQALLESVAGGPGTVAYVLGQLPGKASTTDGSNGDMIVAVAVDGSVETVFYRRSSQDMSADFFGASEVVDMRQHPLYVRTGPPCGACYHPRHEQGRQCAVPSEDGFPCQCFFPIEHR